MGALPDWSPRFEAFVAPARAQPALWRLALGTLLAAAAWIALTAVLLPLAVRHGADGRMVLLGFLASFAALVLGLAVAARLLQRRHLASLLGPGGFRPRQFALGIAVMALVGGLGTLAMFAIDPPRRQAGLGEWAAWLPLALPLILLQTAAEELAFRGYLMQGLAARFRSRAAWWLLPALGFGVLHWNAAEFGPNAALVVLSAVLVGLILADVTIRTGNLSLAMGLHFANNALAMLVIAMPSPLAALSLYLAPLGPADAAAFRRLLLLDLAGTAAAYAVWLAVCARREPFE
jgi:membrane protease YdiL (CAAX protease family)